MLPSELMCRGDEAVDSVDLLGHGGPQFESGLLWYASKFCIFIVTLLVPSLHPGVKIKQASYMNW